jgi:hypothetical protein
MSTLEGKAFTLRLPPELYEPITALAEHERRSLQGQVLYLLDRALDSLEDADAVRAYDAAKAANEDSLPLEEAIAEIEQERAALRKAS